jgi:imidazolonepropionase-like amidohydrolase
MRYMLCCIMVGCMSLLHAPPTVNAQQTVPQTGLRDNTPRVHALTNVRIIPKPGEAIEQGVVVIRDGIVEAVGANVTIPSDAQTLDYTGMTVYPGLIEMFTQAGLEEKKAAVEGGSDHWNVSVQPDYNAANHYQVKTKDIEALRSLGFAMAMVVSNDGIFTGNSVLVNLGDGSPNENIAKEDIIQHLRMERNRDRTYPGSMMGVISMARQTFLDAQWYRSAHMAYAENPNQAAPEDNEALAALTNVIQRQQALLISVSDDHSFLRAAKIARAFNLEFWVKGSGYEYRMLDDIKATGAPVILPLAFPEREDFKVSAPEDAINVSLEALRHWEAAPENPGRLQSAGVPFALSSTGLDKPDQFHARIREAIARGLDYDAALAALTTTPAAMLGMSRQLGTIESGKQAHLTITDGVLFAENVKIRDVWVAGNRYIVTPTPIADPRGTWKAILDQDSSNPISASIELDGSIKNLTGSADINGEQIILGRLSSYEKRIAFTLAGDDIGRPGVVRLSGSIENNQLTGYGVWPDGDQFTWSASLEKPRETEIPAMFVSSGVTSLPKITPPGAFGRPGLPDQPRTVLIRGATVWTLDERGKIENADVLVKEGKISEVGQNLNVPGDALIIDGQGKHVTPGIIDAHSHTAISQGINEGTQAVTAEVGVEDVVNGYDIALYRELAGGLTVANLLHGSANPIGGKNQVIKLRWGASAEDMKFEGAKPGIKFALGENVKRSRSATSTRYPRTRMGVEQLIRDRFKAAQDYDRQWSAYNALKNKTGKIPPRQDLELDTLVEILKDERKVHSHSYRQDEILMLIRIADDFGFTIGTFQHVLEGYKVAIEIAKHGAGASTFSDWWAYKVEAYDAIPYNAAIMHKAGVLVTLNSDSNELARRLNKEAAKAVKYGGVSEIEALKFVTLNAAKQFEIDDRVGSLEAGKDADFVIWSGHPLSTYTICEQTWIDGRRYFDLEEDRVMRKQVEKERMMLIQKLLKPKKKMDMKPEA